MKLFITSTAEKIILVISPKINSVSLIAKKLDTDYSHSSKIIKLLIEEDCIISTKYKDFIKTADCKNFRAKSGEPGNILELTKKGKSIKSHLGAIEKLLQ